MTRAAGALLVAACALAAPARAHGFGQRYDLPLPLSLYMAGAALTVAVSFLMLFVFVRSPSPAPQERSALEAPRRAASLAAWTLRIVGVAAFALVIVAGFLGNQSPLKNIAPALVWAAWWVGMSYVSALVGDLWKVMNPLDTLYRLGHRLRGGRARVAPFRLPPWVGVWPAVAFLVAWLWMEVVWPASDVPAALAGVLVAYSIVTWTGMALFGRREWLESAEVFSRVFGTLARFAPLEVTETPHGFAWRLRPYGSGLVAREPARPSEIVLVVAILAAVSFDGFLETPAWAAILEPLADHAAWVKSAGVVLAPLAFLCVYALACWTIAWAAGAPAAAGRIRGLFVLTLVPIAIGYQVAHYLSFLAMAGQYLVALASDPLGLGWNLFGTAHRFVRPAVLDIRLVWWLSLAAIVAGHVASLYLAHRLSLQEFRDRRAASRSQWPMLVLMVGYTMLSLWIVAQPIVTSRFG